MSKKTKAEKPQKLPFDGWVAPDKCPVCGSIKIIPVCEKKAVACYDCNALINDKGESIH